MQDIKSYVIGFLTCACLLLIIGQTMGDEQIVQMKDTGLRANNQIGKYQAISGNKYEYFYLLDTRTGAVYNHIDNPENTYKKRLADVWNRKPHIHTFSKP